MHLTRVDIDALRSRHRILDVLERLGADTTGRTTGNGDTTIHCPMPNHEDRTPSCVVHTATDRYHCFGCGAHGDVIDLTQILTGTRSFAHAAAWLDRESMELQSSRAARQTGGSGRPARVVVPVSRARIIEINGLAWRQLIQPRRAALAYEYLQRRGIDPSRLVDRHAAGYSPAARDGLTCALRAEGITDFELEMSGWSVRTRDGHRDFFHRRVLLPIRTLDGEIVGVVGRDAAGLSRSKYLNSRATSAYNKGDHLYSPVDLRGSRVERLIVCEGPLDALAVAAAHASEDRPVSAVATCGTALTDAQARLIVGINAGQLLLCTDGDDAGRSARDEWLRTLRCAGGRPQSVTLPDGHDPASWLATGAKIGWPPNLVNQAITL